MSHPYAKDARSGNRAKYEAITGKRGKGQLHPDESQNRRVERAAGGPVKMTGGAEGGLGRLQKAANAKRARGA